MNYLRRLAFLDSLIFCLTAQRSQLNTMDKTFDPLDHVYETLEGQAQSLNAVVDS
jgi:hypothetical protein